MATIAKQEILAVKQAHGANPFSETLKEAASQTFVKGEIVFVNAAGFVEEIGGDTPSAIWGIANGDGHNDAVAGTSEISVTLAYPMQLFAANVLETALADHVLAQTDLGSDMGLLRDTTNSKTYLDALVIAGANIRVHTHTRDRGTSIGDTNGRLQFNFKPNWIQFLGTS